MSWLLTHFHAKFIVSFVTLSVHTKMAFSEARDRPSSVQKLVIATNGLKMCVIDLFHNLGEWGNRHVGDLYSYGYIPVHH